MSERELALEGRKYPEELMPLNQMSGLPMDLAVYGSGTGPQPFVTAKDYDRFLARLRQFPRWADGAIDMMRAGMARGITLPRPAMAKVVPQLREIVTANLDRQHLLGAHRGDAGGNFREGPPAHQRRLRRRAHQRGAARIYAARGFHRA